MNEFGKKDKKNNQFIAFVAYGLYINGSKMKNNKLRCSFVDQPINLNQDIKLL